MASAVASQLDASLADGELASSSAVAQYIIDGCLSDGPLGRVGLEIEAHCYDPVAPQRRPTWDEITDVIRSLPAMPAGSAITVEPGGAVELSGPPADGAVSAIEAMITDQAVLRTAFADAGLGLVLLGADPLRPAKRVNPGARYRAMERFFVASNSGVAGAAMMTSTASVQVNLDAGPQAGWAARVRLAHALGPTMIAIAANSPLLAGEFTGWLSNAIWPAVVFTLVTLLDDPVAADYAAEAVEPVATAWDRAARVGLNDQRLYAAANRCVAVAAERVPIQHAESMQQLVEVVERGRCPADDFSDRVIGHGIAPTVTRLAQGQL